MEALARVRVVLLLRGLRLGQPSLEKNLERRGMNCCCAQRASSRLRERGTLPICGAACLELLCCRREGQARAGLAGEVGRRRSCSCQQGARPAALALCTLHWMVMLREEKRGGQTRPHPPRLEPMAYKAAGSPSAAVCDAHSREDGPSRPGARPPLWRIAWPNAGTLDAPHRLRQACRAWDRPLGVSPCQPRSQLPSAWGALRQTTANAHPAAHSKCRALLRAAPAAVAFPGLSLHPCLLVRRQLHRRPQQGGSCLSGSTGQAPVSIESKHRPSIAQASSRCHSTRVSCAPRTRPFTRPPLTAFGEQVASALTLLSCLRAAATTPRAAQLRVMSLTSNLPSRARPRKRLESLDLDHGEAPPAPSIWKPRAQDPQPSPWRTSCMPQARGSWKHPGNPLEASLVAVGLNLENLRSHAPCGVQRYLRRTVWLSIGADWRGRHRPSVSPKNNTPLTRPNEHRPATGTYRLPGPLPRCHTPPPTRPPPLARSPCRALPAAPPPC